jgi:hypothetical protein
MKLDLHIAAGKSIDEALTAFRESVNQPGTIFSTDHWLLPNPDQLKSLLTDPISQDEADALLDVLYQRRWMRDLIEWAESRPVGWGDFFTHLRNMDQEELRKRADERDLRRANRLDPWCNFKLFPDEAFPKISDLCPDCGSADWKPIGYGLPTEDALEDARRGHYVLGGSAGKDASRYCVVCFNRWPTKPDMSGIGNFRRRKGRSGRAVHAILKERIWRQSSTHHRPDSKSIPILESKQPEKSFVRSGITTQRCPMSHLFRLSCGSWSIRRPAA